jgi:hypothetical protein
MRSKIIEYGSKVNQISIVLYGFLIYLVFSASGNNSFGLISSYETNNSLVSTNKTLFSSATRMLFTVEYRYIILGLIILVLGLSITETFIKNIGKKLIESLNKDLEFIVYGIFFILLCLLTGFQDFSALIVLGGISFVTLRYCLNNLDESFSSKKKMKLGFIICSLPWLIILVSTMSTIIYGGVRLTSYVYASYILVLVYLVSLYILNSDRILNSLKIRTKDKRDFKRLIYFLIRTSVIIVFIFGLHS